MVDYNTSTTLILFRPFTTVKVFFMKLYHAVSVENVLTNIASSVYPNQTDRIGSDGYVSTLIESILSTEWQCLKINWHVQSNHEFKNGLCF